jgi:hypothetical protein
MASLRSITLIVRHPERNSDPRRERIWAAEIDVGVKEFKKALPKCEIAK